MHILLDGDLMAPVCLNSNKEHAALKLKVNYALNKLNICLKLLLFLSNLLYELQTVQRHES